MTLAPVYATTRPALCVLQATGVIFLLLLLLLLLWLAVLLLLLLVPVAVVLARLWRSTDDGDERVLAVRQQTWTLHGACTLRPASRERVPPWM